MKTSIFAGLKSKLSDRNVLKKGIIKVTNSYVTFVFFQASVKVAGRFSNMF